MRMKLQAMVVAVVACAACVASARTIDMTVNKTGDDVTSFDFAFDDVGADKTNSLWIVYGVTDGGSSSFSSWSTVRLVADIPGDVTALTGVQPPPRWGVAVTCLRFFLTDVEVLPGADRLEYIQNSQYGGQFIETSFYPNGDSVVETEIAFNSDPKGGSNQGIFCARAEDYTKTFTLFWLANFWRFDYSNSNYSGDGSTPTPGTDRHALRVDYSGVIVDGTSMANTGLSSVSSYTAGAPLSLFATRLGVGTNWGNYAKVRLYSFRAWNTHADESAFAAWMDGTSTAVAPLPALDLVPCRKNGVIGLYDRPSGAFLAKGGSGDFTAGNVVASAVDAPDVSTELVSSSEDNLVYWTGNGGDDTRISTPANWGAADNETLPDLDSGTTDAMFAIGGSALLDRSVALKSISFASNSGFTFSDSSQTLSVGVGGISTDVSATPTLTHTFNAPVALTAPQTWFANTNATIEFTKPLSFSDASDTLTLAGAGSWNFRVTNTFSNDIVATGDGMTDFGRARVRVYADNALGGPDGTFAMNVQYGALEFHGVTNSRPIVTCCTRSDRDAGVHLIGDAGATNVFDATFSHTNANVDLYLGRGTTFIANEKFTTRSACYAHVSGNGSAKAHWIMNALLSVGDRFNLPADIVLDLNVPTNRINGNKGNIQGRINLNVPYALSHENGSANQPTQFVPNGGTLDLRGNDNGLGIIYTYAASNSGTITSETPATMHLVDNYMLPPYDSGQKDAAGNQIQAFGYTNRVEFTGCASLSKEGKYTNRLMRVSSTYGDLTVTKGRLEMDPGATWANASNLVVKGTGLFTLEEHPEDAPAFGEHLAVRVEPGYDGNGENPKAMIELLNGTPQKCAELYVNGIRQRDGWWGSAAAAAANPRLRVRTAACFTGTGLLLVGHDWGLRIIVR